MKPALYTVIVEIPKETRDHLKTVLETRFGIRLKGWSMGHSRPSCHTTGWWTVLTCFGHLTLEMKEFLDQALTDQNIPEDARMVYTEQPNV